MKEMWVIFINILILDLILLYFFLYSFIMVSRNVIYYKLIERVIKEERMKEIWILYKWNFSITIKRANFKVEETFFYERFITLENSIQFLRFFLWKLSHDEEAKCSFRIAISNCCWNNFSLLWDLRSFIFLNLRIMKIFFFWRLDV